MHLFGSLFHRDLLVVTSDPLGSRKPIYIFDDHLQAVCWFPLPSVSVWCPILILCSLPSLPPKSYLFLLLFQTWGVLFLGGGIPIPASFSFNMLTITSPAHPPSPDQSRHDPERCGLWLKWRSVKGFLTSQSDPCIVLLLWIFVQSVGERGSQLFQLIIHGESPPPVAWPSQWKWYNLCGQSLHLLPVILPESLLGQVSGSQVFRSTIIFIVIMSCILWLVCCSTNGKLIVIFPTNQRSHWTIYASYFLAL